MRRSLFLRERLARHGLEKLISVEPQRPKAPLPSLSLDKISIEYCDNTGGQCPPYGAVIVGRALPASSSAPMQDVIRRQLTRGGDSR